MTLDPNLEMNMLDSIDLEAARDGALWSRYEAPTAGYQERVHFFELLADAENQTRDRGH